MDPAGIIIFLIVMSLLQGLGKVVEWLAEQQKKAQAAQEAEQAGLPPEERRTPFEALVNYMEEQARGQQPRDTAPPPAPTPPTLSVAPAPTPHHSLAQRHLHSVVGDRHSGTGIGDRHMGGLGNREQLTGFRGKDRAELTSLEAIESLSPFQKAIVYSELLGPPRSQEAWRAKKL